MSPPQIAEAAGLIYVHADTPGICRLRHGRGFAYRGPNGQRVTQRDLKRIRTLVIPPAWERVWIAPIINGHLQVTGFDARGRKQYRYHPQWQQIRSLTKFHRLLEFGQALETIRQRLDEGLALPGLPREKILACVIRLLDLTGIRVGNPEYVESNQSFGLTTLCNRHVAVEGSKLEFRFRGKSGVKHRLELVDRRLAKVIARCSELPGELLFQFVDDAGAVHPIGSADVNSLLKEWTGGDFTAKDFRTWAGTTLFFKVISATEPTVAPTITSAVAEVARELRNTPTVCRKYYIHPDLLADFTAGKMIARGQAKVGTQSTVSNRLNEVECALLRYLRHRRVPDTPAA